MKGIAETMLRLLYVSRMQRWLTGFGLAVMLAALYVGRHPGAHGLVALAGTLGAMIVVIGPVVAGPLLFSAMTAPRTMALIPHGRLKLVLGAFGSQLVLAAFIAASLHAMNDAPTVTVFALAFGALTAFFLGFSLTIYYRLAWVWLPLLLLAPRMLPAYPHLGIRLTSPQGLVLVVAISALAWVGYGISLVKRRRIPLSSRSRAAIPRTPVTYTPRDAMRIMLNGDAKVRRGIILAVLFFGAVFFLLTLITAGAPRPGGNPALAFALTTCFMAALMPAVGSGMLARRGARRLWLTSGKGRAELFVAIESQCWRLLFFAVGAGLLMAVPLLAMSHHSVPAPIALVALAVLPLSCGSAAMYACLLYVRGNRFVDILIVAANTLLLLGVAFSAAVSSPAFPFLIGTQIILVPLLRQVAARRWNRIDWLFLRQPPAAARLT